MNAVCFPNDSTAQTMTTKHSNASVAGMSTGSQDILDTTNARLGRLTTLPNSGKPACDVAKGK